MAKIINDKGFFTKWKHWQKFQDDFIDLRQKTIERTCLNISGKIVEEYGGLVQDNFEPSGKSDSKIWACY